jgi:DNA (cytosine-5)-methyltransferase 1
MLRVTLSVIDLFAGCGGMTEGFRQSGGYEPTMAVEWDLHAAATYAANFGEDHMHWGDIAEVPNSDIPEADVVIGGPPCQGFSNLGSRDVNDPRNKLWKQYIRFVQEAHPKVFIIENVERFRRSSEFELLKSEEHGGLLDEYELSDGLLLAANYGVPQRRPRTIIIGSRIGKIELPSPTHSKDGAAPGTRPWRTVRDAIEGLPEIPETTDLPASMTRFFGEDVPGIFKAGALHIGRNPLPKSLARYDSVPPGGGRFDVPEHLLPNCWKNKPTGTTDVMGRMMWDRPSLTIRTEFFKPEKGQYLHPQWERDRPDRRVNRVITHLEAARLQDFPMTYQWCGTKIQIAKQIGNAVPTGLAKAIADHVKPCLLDA